MSKEIPKFGTPVKNVPEFGTPVRPNITPAEKTEVPIFGTPVVGVNEPQDSGFFYAADDFANQFSLALVDLAGAPVDRTSWALNKLSNAIADRDIVPENGFGGSESIRQAFNVLPGEIRREAPSTKAGVVGQVAGETVGFTAPALKIAQVGSKVQATTQAGKVAQQLSKQFVDEATRNTGRFLAIESGAIGGAAAGRILSQDQDLSPGAAIAVEVLTGLTGALAGDRTFGLSKNLMNKARGKTAEQVMEMVASDQISFKELDWTPTAQADVGDNASLIRFNQAQNEIANNLLKKQKASVVVELEDLNNYAPGSDKTPSRRIQKMLSWVAPSKVVGRDVVNEIEKAKGTVAKAEDIGQRVFRSVKRLEKKDPNVSEKFREFMLGGDIDASLKPIEVELETFRSTTRDLKAQFLRGMDDEVFEGLSGGLREGLREVIEASMDTGYLTQTYKLFQDPNYLPTKAQEKAAVKEIKTSILMSSEAGKMTVERAEEMARERINYLASRSARQKKNDGLPKGVTQESQQILKAKTNPGPAERAWLGEVTDPKELAFSTASKLSKLASAKEEDLSIARLLMDSGLASKQSKNPDQVQLKLRSIEGQSGIFVDPEVANSLDILRFGDQIGESKSPLVRAATRFWSSWQGTSKASKVIMNPESYPTNMLGAIAMTVSSGIMPNVSGFRRALSEFGALDNVLSGKNTQGRKALLDDIGKMRQYNLMPKSVNAADLEQTVIRGLRDFKNPAVNALDKGYKGTVDFLGKAYSVFDVALRFTTWKGNQKQLKKMFPDYSNSEIEAAAARLTNNTFANYDKLSDLIRKLSRVGLLQQFVPFTAELTRNMYNQGKYAAQMAAGTFGKDIGLDPARANITSMRLHGAKRGAALLLTVGGSGALVNQYNSNQGIEEDAADAFSFSVAPPWDRNKQLAIKPDKTGRKGKYVNPDYGVPQIMAKQAFDAGFSDKPIEELAALFKERFVGDPGTFPVRSLIKVGITGRDENGNLIYTDPDVMEKAKTAIGIIYDETLKPGAQNTIERWRDTFRGTSDRTVSDNALRMLGVRDYSWDSDAAFRGNFSDIVEPVSEIKRKFSGARYKLQENKITPEQFESEYQQANDSRRRQMDRMRQHYRNMSFKPWAYSEDEKISIMKKAGVSSLEILDIITNQYTDLPKVRPLSTSEVYENLEGNKVQAIKDLSKSDPLEAKRLVDYHKRLQSIEQRNLSAKDKLILGLDVKQRVKYLRSVGADRSRAVLNEYIRKGIATNSVVQALNQ